MYHLVTYIKGRKRLRFFENGVLRRISGRARETRRSYIIRIQIILFVISYLGDLITGDDKARNMRRINAKCLQRSVEKLEVKIGFPINFMVTPCVK